MVDGRRRYADRRVADTDRNLRAATVLADPGSDLWCRLQLLVGENIEHISLENALVHYSAACDDAADGGPSPILADALGRQAHALVNLSRRDGAAEKARASLAMSRELGYLAGVAYSLATLGEAAFHAGRGDEALPWYQQACQVDATEIPGTLSRGCGLLLTNALRRVGDGEAALRISANVLSQAMAADDVSAQTVAHILMADLERRAGHVAAGAAHLRESLRLARRTGSLSLSDSLEICGHLCADRGRWADAISVWSAATALLRASGLSDTPLDVSCGSGGRLDRPSGTCPEACGRTRCDCRRRCRRRASGPARTRRR